jgi:uncharacterized protein YfdQ (DUF2303 family)
MNDTVSAAAHASGGIRPNPKALISDYPEPEEALAVAIRAGLTMAPVHDAPGGRAFALIPENYTLQDVSDPHALRPRPRGEVTVDERQSLTDYLNRFKEDGSVLIADIDRGEIRGLIDYHLASDPASELDDLASRVRAVEHAAVLKLRVSEEFRRWDEAEGKMLPQDEFAFFLDENAADVDEPEAATLIEISRDLEAVQGVQFKSSITTENGDRRFIYEEETRTKGDVVVPRKFILNIPIYAGEAPMQLEARLRYKVSGGGLSLGFAWHRVEYARQALFRQIATAVTENTGVPVFFGRQSRT